jgi:quinol monooxygenase YgiN
VLYAEFTALPSAQGRVQDLLIALSRRVRQEPGNVDFIAHRHPTHTSDFFVYEEYVDQAAFETHVASAHCAQFNEALMSLAVDGRAKVTFLEKI